MLRGKPVTLRPIRPDELDIVYRHLSNVNEKGQWWHLDLPSEQAFRHEFAQNGCWGEREGRVLIVPNGADEGPLSTGFAPVGELIYFRGLDYQAGVEIGYEIFHARDYGKGYVTEALALFCAWLFAARPFNRVQVNLMAENIGSRRVAEKCGFRHEGTMRAATWHRGKYHDLELFSLLREECPPLETLLNGGDDA
jgi:RimJ/RimL family protein N-acetyltransferase